VKQRFWYSEVRCKQVYKYRHTHRCTDECVEIQGEEQLGEVTSRIDI